MTELGKTTDIQNLTKKIIIDHLCFECSINAFKLINSNYTENEVEEMNFRSDVIKFIQEKDTLLAYIKIHEKYKIDERLMVKLGKLSFVDLINKDKTLEAISFAKKYLNSENLDIKKIYTLIGFDLKGMDEFINWCDDVDRNKFCREINNELFYLTKKRRNSLLDLTLEYYQTLVTIKNKIK